jgi:uncharacterized SAM-binding protein YcdF (DUF218 family)
MFYVLSKAFWFLFQPSSLIGLAGIVAVVLLYSGRLYHGRRWAIGVCASVWVCGMLPISDILLAPLEARFARADLTSLANGIDGVIVLGGAEDGRINIMRELMSLNDAGERLTEAVALMRKYPKARLVFSGGSDAILVSKPPEALRAFRFFEALGVDAGRITLEDQSRNTHENAVFTKRLIAPKPGETWLLVTSAFHMPRSMGIFRKVGLELKPWPVDYRTPMGAPLFMPYNSISYGLHRLDFVIKEYVGLFVYWLTGRSEALFPAP